MRTAVSCALALTLLGCGPDFGIRREPVDEDALLPLLTVDPAEIVFGELQGHERDTRTVTLGNEGASPLVIDVLEVRRALSFRVDGLESGPPWEVEPRGSLEVEVVFEPLEGGDLSADLHIASNARNLPVADVPISGRGAIADLVIDPNPIEFGDRYVGCETKRFITLRNPGTETTIIDAMSVDGDAFDFANDELLPITLAPGAFQPVELAFFADAADPFTGEIAVESNIRRGTVRAPLLGKGRYESIDTDTIVVEAQPVLQFIFAVDQSSSMGNVQNGLSASFSSFVNRLANVDAPWRAGVIGLSDCFVGGEITSDMTPAVQQARFDSAVRAGFPSSGINDPSEMLLQRLEKALDWTIPGLGSNNCPGNVGFLDGYSPVHAVFVSDERDQSPGWDSGTITGSGNYWRTYLDRYRLVTQPSTFRAHAVVDVNKTTQDAPSCRQGADWGPFGYREVAQATGGFVFDICSVNWGVYLADIVDLALTDRATFRTLTNLNVVVDELEVRVDGVLVESGWVWDDAARAVVFDAVPDVGSVVEITYPTLPSCP